jgi:hypothetical protein
MLIEMNLAGVRVELPSNQPIVVREVDARLPPIWSAPRGRRDRVALPAVTPCLMTHDLLKNISRR